MVLDEASCIGQRNHLLEVEFSCSGSRVARLCSMDMTYVALYDLVVDEHERIFGLFWEIRVLQAASELHEAIFIQMERIAVEW